MPMNPQTDIQAISADQAREVARINNISMDDAYSRIGRAQASQSGQMRGAEGTYYNPATGERGTNIFTIGRDPSYWGGASMSDRATGTYPSGTVPTVPTAGSVSPSSVGPGMTIGSIYGGTGSALSAYQGRLGALSQPVDEEGIRRAAVDRVQSEIDAMNRFYAEKTRQEKEVARQVGESSLGRNAAINARRGMIGSDFGDARTSTIESANAKVQNDIWELNNAKAAAERAALMGKATEYADSIIEKRQAQLDASLKEAAALEERLRQRAETAADTRIAGLVAQGAAPSEAEYDAIAAQYGIDKATLKAKYAVARPAAEKPIEVGDVLYQKQADGTYKALTPGKSAKADGLMEVSPGASLYDPVTGKFIGTAPARPADNQPEVRNFADNTTRQYNPSTGKWEVLATGTDSGASQNIVQEKNLRTEFNNQLAVKNFMDLQKDYNNSLAIFEEAKRRGMNNETRSAIDQALIFTFNKMLDPTSAVREGEYARTVEGQALLNRVGGFVSRLQQGGAGITDADREAMVNASNVLYKEAQKTYNETARFYTALANDYGLNPERIVRIPASEPMRSGGAQQVSSARLQDVEAAVGMTLGPAQRQSVEEAIRDYPSATVGQIIDALGFSRVGGDTNSAATKPAPAPKAVRTGMRTDRHNNPAAFTTDIARVAGLREGVDYVEGDPFGGGRYHTARLLGDPVATTIKVIDNIGFYTQGGNQRWSHTAMPKARWDAMSYDEKKQVVKKMYEHEGGTQLRNIFA